MTDANPSKMIGDLDALPKGTELHPWNRLSNWGGKLAMVDTPYDSFDPDQMTREFFVRYAVDIRSRKPFKAQDRYVGLEPQFRDRSVPFEKSIWTVSPRMGDRLDGSFDKGQKIKIPLKLRELIPKDHRELKDSLHKRGYTDVSDVGLSLRDWKKYLGMGGVAALQKAPADTSNKIDAFLDRKLRIDTVSDGAVNSAWGKLQKGGVFAETRKGDVKFVYKP